MNEEWRANAACRGMDVNMFFDDYEESAAVQLQVDAICANCIVRMDCLEWALKNHIEGGVWGRKFFGQSTKSRKKRKELV